MVFYCFLSIIPPLSFVGAKKEPPRKKGPSLSAYQHWAFARWPTDRPTRNGKEPWTRSLFSFSLLFLYFLCFGSFVSTHLLLLLCSTFSEMKQVEIPLHQLVRFHFPYTVIRSHLHPIFRLSKYMQYPLYTFPRSTFDTNHILFPALGDKKNPDRSEEVVCSLSNRINMTSGRLWSLWMLFPFFFCCCC